MMKCSRAGRTGFFGGVRGVYVFGALVLGVLLIWALLFWTGKRQSFNVVFISIDTCRSDYLGCYGYSGGTTPNIDKLAGEGVLFENVISPVPLTLPAHSSMLTGTIPPYHGVHDNYNYWLDGSNVTLAEVFRERGFSTAGIVSAFVMDSQFGLEQGFEEYYDEFERRRGGSQRSNERRGGQTSAMAVNWLERQGGKRFFLFLHYYDPHSAYEPPEPYASRFAGNLYAGEIAYTDECIGVVVEKLKSLGLYDSSVIVIAGDHGEMLGEHGEDEHGYFIYQGALKVPLIIKPAGEMKGRRAKEVAGLIDIFPTVLGLCGISGAGEVQGRDLSGYVRGDGEQGEGRYIYAESLYPTKYNGNSLLGVVGRRWKYIETTRPELYDLERDGGESENLVESRGELAGSLQGELKRMLEEGIRVSGSGEAVMDEETRRRLESLGYVARAVEEDFEFSREKADPKDLLGEYKAFVKLSDLMEAGADAEAKALCEELIEKGAGHYEVYRSLGFISAGEGEKGKAVAYMLRSLEGNPNQTDLHNYIGMTLAGGGKAEEGIGYFVKSLELNPNQVGVHFAWGNVLEGQGKLSEAAGHYLKVLEIDSRSAAAHNNLGSIYVRQGDYERAERHCAAALELSPGLAEGYYNMGNVRFQQGRYGEAAENYEKALGLRPVWPEAQRNLSLARRKMGEGRQ